MLDSRELTSCWQSGNMKPHSLSERRVLSQQERLGHSAAMQANPARNQPFFFATRIGPCSCLTFFGQSFYWDFYVLQAHKFLPGPFRQAHQSLNGTTNCTTCHKLAAGQATFKMRGLSHRRFRLGSRRGEAYTPFLNWIQLSGCKRRVGLSSPRSETKSRCDNPRI